MTTSHTIKIYLGNYIIFYTSKCVVNLCCFFFLPAMLMFQVSWGGGGGGE